MSFKNREATAGKSSKFDKKKSFDKLLITMSKF